MSEPLPDHSETSGSAPLDVVEQARLQLALHALMTERRNQLVYCQTPLRAQTASDWVSGQLARRWPQVRICLCGPQEGHRLLEAFNSALQAQPQAAPDDKASSADLTDIWLVQASAFDRPEDLGLVLRMLHSFDQLPLRVVLLLSNGTALPAGSAAHLGHADTLWLDGLGLPLPDSAADREPLAAPISATHAGPVNASSPLPDSLGTSTAWKMPAGVALASILIVGLAWWSQSDELHPAEPLQQASPASPPVPVTPATQAGSARASSTEQAPPGTALAASAPDSSTPDTATALPVTAATGPVQAASQSTEMTGARPLASPQSGNAPTTTATGARQALRWLNNLPAETWLVEHSSHSSHALAQRSTAGQKHLREARIVPVRSQGQTRYLVLTGPFRSLDRAKNYQQRLQLKGTPHKTAILRRQLAS